MKFRGLTSTGDFMLGQGLGSYATGQAAIALDISTRLKQWKGSAFFAPNDGVDYTNLLEKGQQKNLTTAISNCILQTSGVVKILSMDVSFKPQTRALSLTYTIQTIYSQKFTATINNILGVQN